MGITPAPAVGPERLGIWRRVRLSRLLAVAGGLAELTVALVSGWGQVVAASLGLVFTFSAIMTTSY